MASCLKFRALHQVQDLAGVVGPETDRACASYQFDDPSYHDSPPGLNVGTVRAVRKYSYFRKKVS